MSTVRVSFEAVSEAPPRLGDFCRLSRIQWNEAPGQGIGFGALHLSPERVAYEAERDIASVTHGRGPFVAQIEVTGRTPYVVTQATFGR
jgi:hypothetical protein